MILPKLFDPKRAAVSAETAAVKLPLGILRPPYAGSYTLDDPIAANEIADYVKRYTAIGVAVALASAGSGAYRFGISYPKEHANRVLAEVMSDYGDVDDGSTVVDQSLIDSTYTARESGDASPAFWALVKLAGLRRPA